MKQRGLEGVIAIIQDQIDRSRKGSTRKMSSNIEISRMLGMGDYKTYASKFMRKYFSNEDRKYRADILIKINGSKVGYKTMADKTGIYNKAYVEQRVNYSSAGGIASYNKNKGIHSLDSEKKSYFGQLGRLLYLLVQKFKR
jgi:hypothetical protein